MRHGQEQQLHVTKVNLNYLIMVVRREERLIQVTMKNNPIR